MPHERLRLLVLNALVTALALVLPPAFHLVGLGSRFLPLLLPLLVNGFLSPLRWALLTGALAPLASAVATGMPPLYPPLAASRFDVVLCFGVLPHFEDREGALREIARVLRPGGVLAVGHLMGSAELNAFHRGLGGPVAADQLPPSEELAAELRRLGMVRVAAHEAPDEYFVRGEMPR